MDYPWIVNENKLKNLFFNFIIIQLAINNFNYNNVLIKLSNLK